MKINDLLNERISGGDLSESVIGVIYSVVDTITGFISDEDLQNIAQDGLDYQDIFGYYRETLIKDLSRETKKLVAQENPADYFEYKGIGTGEDAEVRGYFDNYDSLSYALFLSNDTIKQSCQWLATVILQHVEKNNAIRNTINSEFITSPGGKELLSEIVHELTHVIQVARMSTKVDTVKEFIAIEYIGIDITNNIDSRKQKDISHASKHMIYPKELDAYVKESVSQLISLYKKAIAAGYDKDSVKHLVLQRTKLVVDNSREEIPEFARSSDPYKRKKYQALIKRVYTDIKEYLDQQ